MADEHISEAPVWLIRHICRPENHRLTKRPDNWYSSRGQSDNWHNRFDKPWERNAQPSRYLPTHYARQGVTSTLPENRVRHLNTNDYRLWSEVREGITGWHNQAAQQIKVRCRWCLSRISLKDFEAQAKRLHKGNCPYTHNLRLVYEHLLQNGACAMCDCVTSRQKWGVPLCSPKCEANWVFAETTSLPMIDAIRELKAAKKFMEFPEGDFQDASFHDRMFD